MNKKSGKIRKICLITSLVFSCSLLVGSITEKQIRKQEDKIRFKDIEHLMTTTPYGQPVYLKYKNNPIPVILKDFEEPYKTEAINAIKCLDDIIENIDYKILDKDDLKIRQKIVVYNDVDFYNDPRISEDSRDSLGIASIKINVKKAVIQLPVTIYLSEDLQDMHNPDTNESAVSYILKHEMMHTLGFKDVYNLDSIMHYSFGPENELTTYSETDIKNIKQIYDNELLIRKSPRLLKITPYYNEKQYYDNSIEPEIEFIK